MQSADMMLRVLLALALLAASPEVARSNPADAAREAASALRAAAGSLRGARRTRARADALTEAVRAFEDGHAVMREILRRMVRHEVTLQDRLAAYEVEIETAYGVLLSVSATPSVVRMAHPSGAEGSARAAMLLAGMMPELADRAAQSRHDLEETRTRRLIQEAASDRLSSHLERIRQARTSLSQAVADRIDLPRRLADDPEALGRLFDAAQMLEDVALGLPDALLEGDAARADPVGQRKGMLALPVDGHVLRRPGEPDAAGVTRAGIVVAASPGATVNSPVAATIRYIGPLLDLGHVVIVEPQADLLFVFSGLSEVVAEQGRIVAEGAPLGRMGASAAAAETIPLEDADGAGAARVETLYIEVRQGGRPVDPLIWFRTAKDG